jgi:hypothetical protein
MLPLPAGALAGDGAYARLSVFAEPAASGGTSLPVGLEQFDLQPATAVVWGYDSGWHEPEYNPGIGRLWRWTSDRATLRIHHGGRDVRVSLTGESPLRYFDEAPTVSVSVGERRVESLEPRADFTHEVLIPADALDRAGGRVTIETSRSFVPDEVSGNGDRRRLGLRIWETTVR